MLQHILKKIKANILPLVISTILMLIAIGMTIATDYILTTKHYVGIGCLLLSAILYFTNRKFYFLFFALTLTIGLIGFLDFNITTFKVGFAGIGINPVFLGLMILFFAVSREQMDKISPEKDGPKKRILNESLIKSFQSKFSDKTVAELNEIIGENSKFTDEAKEAAKRILDEKNVL